MTAPELAVLVPTRDRPALLAAAVDSALALEDVAVEVVVVDDGSATPLQLPADPRLRVIRHPTSRGGAAARNTGLAAATAPHVTYLDDDDLLLPAMARRALDALARASLPPPVGVLSGLAEVDEHGRRGAVRLPPTLPRGRAFALEEVQPGRSFYTKQTLVVGRDVLAGVGGWDERFRSRVHTELFLRLNRICSLSGLDEVGYLLRVHAGPRVSADPARRQESFARLLDVHAPLFRGHRGRWADHVLDHALLTWDDGDRPRALAHWGRALRLAPGRTLRGTAVSAVERLGVARTERAASDGGAT